MWELGHIKLSARELMLLTCGVAEDSWEYLELQGVNPKKNQSWIFTGRTDADSEALILWQPDAKNWLIGKDPDAGKDWRQEKRGMTEDEMGGWHHWLDGHEFEQAPGMGDGQGNLAYCSPWGHKELETTELNWYTYLLFSYFTYKGSVKPTNHRFAFSKPWEFFLLIHAINNVSLHEQMHM